MPQAGNVTHYSIEHKNGTVTTFESPYTDAQATEIVTKRYHVDRDLKNRLALDLLQYAKRLSHKQRAWLHYFATSQDKLKKK